MGWVVPPSVLTIVLAVGAVGPRLTEQDPTLLTPQLTTLLLVLVHHLLVLLLLVLLLLLLLFDPFHLFWRRLRGLGTDFPLLHLA